MDNNNKSGLTITLALVAAITGGVFFLRPDLESFRPTLNTDFTGYSQGAEFVSTRLWQDPLLAIQDHWQTIVSSIEQRNALPAEIALPSTISNLPDSFNLTATKHGRALRLFVIQRPGSFAEDLEQRRRQRYAIISALTDNDYVPLDSGNIGYFLAPRLSQLGGDLNNSSNSCNALNLRCPLLDSPILVGYENYQLTNEQGFSDEDGDDEDNPNSESEFKSHLKESHSVQIIWLSESDFQFSPIDQLATIIHAIDSNSQTTPTGTTQNIILGPSGSGGLKRLHNSGIADNSEQIRFYHEYVSNYPELATDVLFSIGNAPEFSIGNSANLQSQYAPSPNQVASLKIKSIDYLDNYLDQGLSSELEANLENCLSNRDASLSSCLSSTSFSEVSDSNPNWITAVSFEEIVNTENPSAIGSLINRVSQNKDWIKSVLILMHHYLDSGLKLEHEEGISNATNCLNSIGSIQNSLDQISSCLERSEIIDTTDDSWESSVASVWLQVNAGIFFNEISSASDVVKSIEQKKDQLLVLSPLATGPLNKILLAPELSINEDAKALDVEDTLSERLEVAAFRSLVARDDLSIREIIREIDGRAAADCNDEDRELTFLIVSEQDTDYGRLLDDIAEDELEYLKGELRCDYEVIEIGYLQGIDGEIPTSSSMYGRGETGGNNSSDGQSAVSALNDFIAVGSKENDIGPSQFDYVSRLAEEVRQGTTSDDGTPQTIVAVGILGSDVYDKLLILQALKPRLPGSVFFTTDLDTRLYGPSVYSFTRNLLVASSYNLKLKDQPTAAFRDNYQTSTYRAVTESLNLLGNGEVVTRASDDQNDLLNFPPPTPLLFEIGRSGPINVKSQAAGRELIVGANGDEIHGDFNLVTEKPFLGIFPIGQLLIAPLIALLVFSLWQLRKAKLNTKEISERWYTLISIVAAVSIILGIFSMLIYGSSDEPTLMFQGVSSIPTNHIAMQVCVIAICFVMMIVMRIKQGLFELVDVVDNTVDQSANENKQSEDEQIVDEQDKEEREFPKIHIEIQKYEESVFSLKSILLLLALTGIVSGIVYLVIIDSPQPRLVFEPSGIYEIIRPIAVFLSLFALLLCSHVMNTSSQLIRKIAKNKYQKWPTENQSLMNFPTNVRQRCQKMKVITRLTEIVLPLFYMPCILIALLLVSRANIFDGWPWTISLVILYSAFLAYIVFESILFQKRAVEGRATILKQLNRLRADYIDDRIESGQLQLAIEAIENDHRGAFAHWSEHPVLKAIALPSGSLGLLALFL